MWTVGGWQGLAYSIVFAIAAIPGLPIGFALFGRRHAGGWISGAILGYALTTLAWWAVVFAARPSLVAFVGAWAALVVIAWLATRALHAPLVTLPEWTRRETTALCLLLLLVPLLLTRPFDRIGARDAEGNRQYRAYFIADFVWHAALTAELAKQTPRPRNPLLADQPLHYYWTYFRIPATVAANTGMAVERVLKLNAVGTGLLLLSALFLTTWILARGRPILSATSVGIVVCCASIEGLAVIAQLVRLGQPLDGLRDVNIDAAAAWAFKGLRIDNLPRTMWYTPQHGFSLALGLVAVPVAAAAGVAAPLAAILLAGCALGAAVAFNPLLGAAFCGIYGVTIVADAMSKQALSGILRHLLAVIPVGLALAWCSLNQVGDGAGGIVHLGFWGPARNATVLNLALQFGPLIPLLAIGLWPGSPLRFSRTPAIAGVMVGLLVMHLVTLTVDLFWVGFRGGNLVFVSAPVLVAAGLARVWAAKQKRWRYAVCIVVLAGLPTTAIDAFNSQDVANRRICCNDHFDFHWTVVLTPDEQQALEWIRTQTPVDAVVQHETTLRGRETWSLIPTFAERRLAAGEPLPLLALPIYAERAAVVKRIYASDDAREAWENARRLGIDYLYADATERRAYPGVTKFERSPEYFSVAFQNSEAAVFRVRPAP